MINQAFLPLQAGGGLGPEDRMVAVLLGQGIISDAISLDCVSEGHQREPHECTASAPSDPARFP